MEHLTYRKLLATLKDLAKHSPDKLDDIVFMVGGTETPLAATHTEFNDGSIAEVGQYQLLLMTV